MAGFVPFTKSGNTLSEISLRFENEMLYDEIDSAQIFPQGLQTISLEHVRECLR